MIHQHYSYCLIIDLDAQGNASTGLGVTLEDRKLSTYDMILGTHDMVDILKITES